MAAMRARGVLFLLGVALCSRALFGAGPSVLMVYGDTLPRPIIIVKENPGDHHYLSCMGSQFIDRDQASAGPFLNIAIFWLPSPEAVTQELLGRLKPEEASQHARLYLPSKDRRASVVVTPYSSQPGVRVPGYDTEQFTPIPRPVPREVSEFTKGCWLTDSDLAAARKSGITGL
jgi:hypothetical protein